MKFYLHYQNYQDALLFSKCYKKVYLLITTKSTVLLFTYPVPNSIFAFISKHPL